MGAFSGGGSEEKEPSKKQRAEVSPPCAATRLRPPRGLARVYMMRSQYPRSRCRSRIPHSELFESKNSVFLSRAQASNTADAQ